MGRRINSGLALGVRGQVSIENYELISKLVAQAVPGDINLADPKYNDFHDYIERRKDKDSEGNFDFVAHGGPKSVEIYVNGKTHEVDWRTVAKIIKVDKKYYRGQPIKLLSCSTGKLDNGFAQNLANKLNTIVYAPRTTLWAESDGSYYISECRTGSIREEFRIFYPRKGSSR